MIDEQTSSVNKTCTQAIKQHIKTGFLMSFRQIHIEYVFCSIQINIEPIADNII